MGYYGINHAGNELDTTLAQQRNSIFVEKLDGLYFIDIRPAMGDEKGDIREDLFLSDRLHLNRQAQEIWIPIILDAMKSGDELKNVTGNLEETKKQRDTVLSTK